MDDSREFGLLIPYERNEFGKFLAGLLKSPKSIEYRTAIDFLVTTETVLSVDKALFQRLKEQQRYDEVEFRVSIRYADGVRYTYTDRKGFDEHAYLPESHPVSIDIKWVFLLDLPDESVPQKQEVNIDFDVNGGERLYSKYASFESIADFDYARQKGGQAGFIIHHTHVTLGADLAAILTALLKRLDSEKSTAHKAIMSKWFGWVWRGVAIFTGVAIVLYGLLRLNGAIVSFGGGPESVVGNGFLSISITLTLIASVLSGVGIASFSEMLLQKIRMRPPSAIALTTGELQRAEKKIKSFGRRKMEVAAALIANLLVGITSSILAAKLLASLAG